jgi:divalent metal cation (Fe/Co/Zn/Cd) transporter
MSPMNDITPGMSARVELPSSRCCGDEPSRAVSGSMRSLAAYVVLSAGWSLWARQGAEFSIVGLIVSAVAIPVMRYLARRKIKLAKQLGGRAMRADAIESITCGWLSLVVVISLAAQAALVRGGLIPWARWRSSGS